MDWLIITLINKKQNKLKQTKTNQNKKKLWGKKKRLVGIPCWGE